MPPVPTILPAHAASPAYRDPHPLPLDTLHVRMDEVGTHGGRFVVAQTSPPRTFNGMMAAETSSQEVTGRLFASLVFFSRVTHRTESGLAKSWESSPDGLTWTLHLRRGARFSDGHPITSADVLFSFEVCYDPKLHPPQQDALKVDGKKMEVAAPDSYTVVIRLPTRHPLFLNALGGLLILPRHVLEPRFRQGLFASAYHTATKPESLVTSGAFRLKQYVPNEKVVLSPNPYWYGADARGRRIPYLDELVFLVVSDMNTASLQFQSGNLDALDIVSAQDYVWYSENQEKGDFTFHDLGPMLGVQYVVFNLNRVHEPKPGQQVGDPYVDPTRYAWFGDPMFRRAVSHAIDRDAMIRGAFMGEGVKNWSLATVADKVWYTPEVTGYDYDPAESRRLLAGMGFRDRDGDGVLENAHGNPLSFTLKTNGDNLVRMQMGNFIRDDLAKVGIRCILSGVDFNRLITNLRSDFQYEAMLFGLNPGVPPDPGANQSFLKSSGTMHVWNVGQSRPETEAEAEIDRLMAENVSSDDMAIRRRTWLETQKILNRECFVIWLPTPRWRVPIRNGFGNLVPSVIPPRILWNIDCVFVKPSRASRSAR